MKIKIFVVCFVLGFFSFSLWGQVQYRPIPSFERHEISSGFSFSLGITGDGVLENGIENLSEKKEIKNLSENFHNFFLKYAFYFPEVNSLFLESYQDVFIPGLVIGMNLFRDQKTFSSLEGIKENYGICEANDSIYPLNYYLGLKGKNNSFEFFQAFAEFGFVRSLCYSTKLSKGFDPISQLSYYLSYSFFFSFKILDKMAIYALDQEYGINDIGIKAECSHYYPNQPESFRFFCQFGLQTSF